MAMKRDVRWAYRAILKPGKIINVNNLLECYEEYEAIRHKFQTGTDIPGVFRDMLFYVKIPKYLQWLRGYIAKPNEETK